MPKVIVIGAGLCGLYAAKVLKESATENIDVTVIEARDRVGGRTLTVEDDTVPAMVDLGGAYIGKQHKLLLKLAEELEVETYKVYSEGHLAVDMKGIGHTFTSPDYMSWNPVIIIDTLHILWLINKLTQEVPCSQPWRAPRAREWDQITFLRFLKNNTWTKTARSIIHFAVRSLFCCELHEISLLGALAAFRSAGGLEEMMGVEDGQQEYKFVGGSQQLCEELARALEVVLLLGQHVVKIDDQPGQQVKVMTLEGKIFRADYVINAIPTSLLGHIVYSPPLPGPKLQFLQRKPSGSVIKAIMFYQRPFWREKGLSGEILTDYGPIHYSIDDTQPDGTCPALLTFISASTATELSQKSVEERRDLLAQHYARVFRDKRYLRPVHYAEKDWTSEEYSGGCYGSYEPVGSITQFRGLMEEPHGRVIFAGADLCPVWSGYMEGALLSGETAAIQVLKNLGLCSESMKEGSLASSIREMEEHVTKSANFGWISVDHVMIMLGLLVVLLAAAMFWIPGIWWW